MSRARPISCSAADGGAPSAAFAAAWARRPPGQPVLAVSGGGDSVALLRLVAATGDSPVVLTFDHGLRPESADEAAWVARLCRELGVEHHVVRWRERPRAGNLQAAAREARYRRICAWAEARQAGCVVTGHTLDDQAETVLMRLARGSGLDGLAAMRECTRREGTILFRPLLGLGRAELRAWLRGLGQEWIEDPSNTDPRFDRAKLRAGLEHLSGLGLTPRRLGRTAAHMARAADALEAVLDAWAGENLTVGRAGEAGIARQAYAALPEELRLRMLARTLCLVAGQVYRPRFAALAPIAALLAGRAETSRTLHGCLIRAGRGTIVIAREPAAVAPPVPVGPSGAAWDGRWHIVPPGGAEAGLTVGALGEAGLSALDPAETSREWQAAPRPARLAAPGIWQGARLLAAPLAGPAAAAGWRARLLRDGARSCGPADDGSAV